MFNELLARLKHTAALLQELPPLPLGRAYVIWRDAEGIVRSYELGDRVWVTFGRATDIGLIRLPGSSVSRRHFQIVPSRPAGHLLVDLDSANGSWVNGERCRRRELNSGDIIEVGESLLAYLTD